jgi:hypothetical protein
MRLSELLVIPFSYNFIFIYQHSAYHWVRRYVACTQAGKLQATVHIFFIIGQGTKIRIKK